MASSASTGNSMNKIERAHQMYREGKYEEALEFYTDALSLAKTKPQKIALHSNRAACFLKLLLFNKAAEECTSVLELDHKHTGALMLRAQTLVTLKEYHSALFDVNRLIELNPSSEVYQNLHARLKTQLHHAPLTFKRSSCCCLRKSLAPIPESEAELEEDEDGELSNNDSECIMDDGFRKTMPDTPANEVSSHAQNPEKSDGQRAGWQAIPQPKGHSRLDYSRWDRVEEESSEEDEDDDDDDDESDEHNPRYRFKVKTVGVRAVK